MDEPPYNDKYITDRYETYGERGRDAVIGENDELFEFAPGGHGTGMTIVDLTCTDVNEVAASLERTSREVRREGSHAVVKDPWGTQLRIRP